MTVNKGYRIITCILPFHQTHSLLEKLDQEKNIITANKSSARGSSYTTDFKPVEMEILEVIVEEARADEIFTYLFHEAHIDQAGGGMIYEHELETMTSYNLPTFTSS